VVVGVTESLTSAKLIFTLIGFAVCLFNVRCSFPPFRTISLFANGQTGSSFPFLRYSPSRERVQVPECPMELLILGEASLPISSGF